MLRYRKEIDGLRAVAVIPVILGHAGVSFLKGGFLGVDVFFVISGYLITSLIYKDLQNKKFSIINFYERRARRLLPALLLVLATTSVVGYFFLLPEDLENLGQSIVATLLFSNNILLYLTSGYWAMEADFKPLVHTWSLGVEEQYYLLAPLIMVILYRFGKKVLFIAFSITLVISLAYSQYTSQSAPVFGFLMIFTRAWELAIGALVALVMISPTYKKLHRHPLGDTFAILGFIMIVVSMLLFDQNTLHPSVLTLPPVLGTALILIFANSANQMGRFLSLPLFVGVGMISYSAYLWHQPLFAYARLFSLNPPSLQLMLMLSALSLVLAYLSWRFVEQPFRKNVEVPNKYFIPGVVLGCTLFSIIGLWWYNTSGLVTRFDEIYAGGEIKSQMNRGYTDSVFSMERDSFAGMKKSKNLLVIGNSFARDFIHMGLENNYFSDHNVVYLSSSSINMNPDSIKENNKLFCESDIIIFASGYGFEGAIKTLNFIETLKKITPAETLVVGTKNFGWNNNAVMLLSKDKRYSYKAKILDKTLQHNEEAKKIIPENKYIDLLSLLGMENKRIPVFTPDRKLISQDRRHFTKSGAKYAGSLAFEDPRLQALK